MPCSRPPSPTTSNRNSYPMDCPIFGVGPIPGPGSKIPRPITLVPVAVRVLFALVFPFFSFFFFFFYSLTHSSILTPSNLMNMHAIDSDAIEVSRNFIMDWVEKSSTYKRWVSQMLLNMEPRSYQASITKSLLKTGWSRTSGAGRYMYVESISLVADWYCLFLYFITGIQLRFSLLLRGVLPPSAPVLILFVVLFQNPPACSFFLHCGF